MKLGVCFLGTYPPRECGIATFTYDLRKALFGHQEEVDAGVIAVTNGTEKYSRPEVVFEIRQNHLSDYRVAAEYINLSRFNAVCINHEFGIFGGTQGAYITEFLEKLRKPVVTTLHTVLEEPESGYRDSLVRVAAASDYVVVMNSKAIPILKNVYGISESKVSLIHHGVPDAPFVDANFYKDKFGVEGRFVIMTFGLLSRNKGIEMMLEALPEIIRLYPKVVYMVLGETHPEVKRREGEEYRLWLQRRVRELGLENHVIFHDRYVELSELLEFIGACDIYVTPYRAKAQIVSGTLAYAVGMGKAVISTPYLYAEELLSDGRGRLVEFGDSHGLAQTLIKLVDKPSTRHRMRKKAYEFGRQMVWSEVAARYVELFRRATTSRKKVPLRPSRTAATITYELPEIKLDHLLRLTDDTGLFQHATYGVPDRRFGYATDDVARALVVAMLHHRQFRNDVTLDLSMKYLSFLQYAQLPDGQFHNFLSSSREFLDEKGGEDTLGRAVWGLGTVVTYSPNEGMRALAREMFEKALKALDLSYPRSIAYAICGLFNFLQRYDGAAGVRRKLTSLADQLAELYQRSRADDWRWFGDDITYANAKIPHAMLLASAVTGLSSYRDIGLESLDFLISQTYRDGYFDFVGNQGWYRRGGDRAVMGQQPIEAGYTVEACLAAYEVTANNRYLELSRAAAEWLLGRNRLGASVYEFQTGACADGLDPQGVSMNKGAESVVCCLLTFLVISAHHQKELEAQRMSSEAVASIRAAS